jgi:hypothetical protein
MDGEAQPVAPGVPVIPPRRSDRELYCDLVAYFSCKDPKVCREVLNAPDSTIRPGSYFENATLTAEYGAAVVDSANAVVAAAQIRASTIDFRHQGECAPGQG